MRLRLIPIRRAGIVVVQQVDMPMFDSHADRFFKPDWILDMEAIHAICPLPWPTERISGINRQSLPRGVVLSSRTKRRVEIILRTKTAMAAREMACLFIPLF